MYRQYGQNVPRGFYRFPQRQDQWRGRSRDRFFQPPDTPRSRSQSRNRNKAMREKHRDTVGGPFNGQVPAGGATETIGVYNHNYPHNHDDPEVRNTSPNDWTWPTRARITDVKHSQDGDVATHVYVITYYTVQVSTGGGIAGPGVLKKKKKNESDAIKFTDLGIGNLKI